MTTIKIDGLKELGQAMRGLTEDVNKRIARAATGAAAQVIRKQAIQNAPVDTGNLKRNIIAKRLPPAETSLTSEHIVTVRQGKVTKKQKEKGLKDAFYGRFVEFGTVKAPAQPYLRPAFDSKKEEAVRAMTDRLKARIDREYRS